MAIGAGNLPAVIQQIQQLYQDLNALKEFAESAQVLVNANYLLDLPGVSDKIQMTTQEQSDMFAAYIQLKATLETDVQALP